MRKERPSQPWASPHAIAAAATAYAARPADHARSSGRRVARQRAARSPARRNERSAAAKATSASTCAEVRALGSERGEAVPVHARTDARAAGGARCCRRARSSTTAAPTSCPVYERVLTRLRDVCRTENDVLLFGSSGTGAFESAVANLVSPGEPHLVVSAGAFGERWEAMATAFGADVDVLRYAWGETPTPTTCARGCASARRRRSGSSSPRRRPASSPTSRRSPPRRRRRALSSSSTRSRASARSRARRTRGDSTSSSPARRRR